MAVRVFGIRHHGPGSTRSLLRALDAFAPDAVVIEGPPDAEDVLPLAVHEAMRPPVALLVYPPDRPARAAFYPFAEYSPEWQAIRYALERKLPLRFMDLPQRHALALEFEKEAATATEANPEPSEAAEGTEGTEEEEGEQAPDVKEDPFTVFAQAAGHSDAELWWEEQVERRHDPSELFEAIVEAMTALREEFPEHNERDILREAHMRRTLRAVRKEGYDRIAVVCGAWHAPVLLEDALDGKRADCSAKEDEARLRGLPKVNTTATWIPWTYRRLSFRSGYRSGVYSPGWYLHLWNEPREASVGWIAQAARLLRGEDLDASSASIIEAVRMADALASLRERPVPGLAEINEAMLAVLCHGESAPMLLIRDKLEIGDVLGEVAAETPSVPLAEDLAAQQRSLRLKPTTEIKTLDLDLRDDSGLARSRLLHRLGLLGIHWGQPARGSAGKSTFHEYWQVQWQPEFVVAVIEANVWGNTVEAASSAAAVDAAEKASELAPLTELLDKTLLADLPAAVEGILTRLQERAAVAADVRHLMDALPSLARAARYGDVRRTRAENLLPVFVGMFERVVVGLPAACASLDDEAAERMLESMAHVSDSLAILDRPDLLEEWYGVLRRIHELSVHGLLRGWTCRLLFEAGVLPQDELYIAARLALSRAVPPGEAAAWIQGLLRGSGQVLLHQDSLWLVLDEWLRDLDGAVFVELLPLLRRAFSGFQAAERRAMGEKVKHLKPSAAASAAVTPAAFSVDESRAERVLPVLAHILGVPFENVHR